MAPAGFEPTTQTGKRPQAYAFDRTTTGTGTYDCRYHKYIDEYHCALTTGLNRSVTSLTNEVLYMSG